MSVGDVLIIFRMSAVAVCCSKASVATRCKSAYDGADGASAWGRWRGVPHSPQNFIVGRFSCLHRGHVMQGLPGGRVGEGSEPWAETSMVKNTGTGTGSDWQDVAVRGSQPSVGRCRRSIA